MSAEALTITTDFGRAPEKSSLRESLLHHLHQLHDTVLFIKYQRQLPAHQVFRSHLYLPDINNSQDHVFWLNMIDVRQQMQQTFEGALTSAEDMKRWFADLHSTAMLGADGHRDYKSPSKTDITPGKYRSRSVISHIPLELGNELETWSTIFPAIIVPGKSKYTEITLPLEESIEDKAKSVQEFKANGHPTFFLSSDYFTNTIMYCSGGNIDRHLTAIWETVKKIEAGKSIDVVYDIGKIIAYWSIAHPFPRVNHSLLMNFVNFLLDKHGLKTVPASLGLWPLAVAMNNRFPEYFLAYYQRYGLTKLNAWGIANRSKKVNLESYLPVPLEDRR